MIGLSEVGCVSNPSSDEPNDVIAKLNQRDAQIDNLQKRVQELEQHSTAVAQIKPTPTAQPTPHVTAVASAAPAGSPSAAYFSERDRSFRGIVTDAGGLHGER